MVIAGQVLLGQVRGFRERMEEEERAALYLRIDNARHIHVLEEEIEALRCNPFHQRGDPVLLPPLCDLEGRKTQGFGQNKLNYGGMGLHGHPGIDWAIPSGTPVRSSHSGTVFFSGGDPRTGYGKHVKVRSRSGKRGMETVYAHLSRTVVSEGQVVRRGQLLGYSGDTGFSSRPHLHFGVRFLWYCDKEGQTRRPCEVLNGSNGYLGWVDPLPYL